jgi:hypothetical protein
MAVTAKWCGGFYKEKTDSSMAPVLSFNFKDLIGPLLPIGLALAGTASMGIAVFNERRMHRHRQPGVTYVEATFRKDGGWRRTELFTPAGLQHQRMASRYGFLGALLWILALLAAIVL